MTTGNVRGSFSQNKSWGRLLSLQGRTRMARHTAGGGDRLRDGKGSLWPEDKMRS